MPPGQGCQGKWEYWQVAGNQDERLLRSTGSITQGSRLVLWSKRYCWQ